MRIVNDDGELQFVESLSLLKNGSPQETAGCAAVVVSKDGTMIFSSVRGEGHDYVTVLGCKEEAEGKLCFSVLQHFGGFGSCPRDICLHPSEPLIYVASQNSDRITAFRTDGNPSSPVYEFGESVECLTPVSITPLVGVPRN
jgi:6-phosphogluconolactonase (cycloisomerase 2 family)